jgi:ATP-binding cassette subfamily B multidrug efflux pump
MFKWFEKRVDPYPEEGLNQPLPTTFFPFVWQAAKGVRGYLLILILFTAGAASFEALFYAKIGDLVNWLSKSQPETFLFSSLFYFSILLTSDKIKIKYIRY